MLLNKEFADLGVQIERFSYFRLFYCRIKMLVMQSKIGKKIKKSSANV